MHITKQIITQKKTPQTKNMEKWINKQTAQKIQPNMEFAKWFSTVSKQKKLTESGDYEEPELLLEALISDLKCAKTTTCDMASKKNFSRAVDLMLEKWRLKKSSFKSKKENTEVESIIWDDPIEPMEPIDCEFENSPSNCQLTTMTLDEYIVYIKKDLQNEKQVEPNNVLFFYEATPESSQQFNIIFQDHKGLYWDIESSYHKKMFFCKICGKKYFYRSSLREHFNIHYRHYYACQCEKKFLSQRTLAKHKIKH